MIYKNMFWKKRFFRFLKEEDAYGKWVYNLNKKLNDESVSKDYLSTFVLNEEDKCENAIDFAFVWSKTSQGYDFWEDINNRWLALLGKIKIKYCKS